MVAAPSFDRSEAGSLKMLNVGARRVAIGLHVTLTGQVQADEPGLSPDAPRHIRFARGDDGARTVRPARPQRLLAAEIATQLKAFVTQFGQPPDFIDGHQHVHLFPQVREALLDVVKERRAAGLGAPMRPRADAAAHRSGITRRGSSMR